MKKKLLLIILLLIVTNGFTQTVYRIRLRSSSYSAQLRGITGTPTVGISINGSYSSKYLSHYFLVSVTGNYELYIDPLGGVTYIEDTDWDDGQDGKTIYADDLIDHMYGHGSGASDKIATADLVDSLITLIKLSTAVKNYIGAAGAVPGGSDTYVQFNDGGSFGADSYFIWDDVNRKLCISPTHSYDYGDAVHIENLDINSASDYYGLVSIFKKRDGASDIDTWYIGSQTQMRISDSDKSHGNIWGHYVDAWLEWGTIGSVGSERNLYGMEINYGTTTGTINGNIYGLYIDGGVTGATITGRKYDIFIDGGTAYPKIGLHNETHTDTDASRYSLIDWLGEQSGGEISVLARIGAFHDGTNDDQKGKLRFYVNDGDDNDSPIERLNIDSNGNVNLINNGQIYNNTVYDRIILPLDKPSSMNSDTLWFFENNFNATVTIDSIRCRVTTDNQDVYIVKSARNGGSIAIIDEITVSTDGIGEVFYQTETVLTTNTLAIGCYLGMLKPTVTSDNVVVSIYYHYIKQLR